MRPSQTYDENNRRTVDLRREGSNDISALGTGSLKEDGSTFGLVDLDLVQSTVGLDLDLLTVDDLNSSDNIIKDDTRASGSLNGDGSTLTLDGNDGVLDLEDGKF